MAAGKQTISTADFRSFYDFLAQQKGFTISSHFLADVDGVCSAFLLKSLFPSARIVFFDRPSKEARAVCDAYNLEYITTPIIDPASTLLVDVDDPVLIPPAHHKEFLGIIDHHHTQHLKSVRRISDAAAPSTTHIIYLMMKAAGIMPTKRQAELILLGIIADTNRFKSVENPQAFLDVAELFSVCGKSYDSLVSLISVTRMSTSERIVFARSFKNFNLLHSTAGDYLFILTDCEAFQSLVADRLVECMEVDFSLTYAPVGNEMRISMRSSPRFPLHLGMFASTLASRLGGSGGGHRHAAGINTPPLLGKRIEDEAIKLLRETFTLREC